MQDMKPLQTQTLAQGLKTIVPSDYALSFDIIPMGLVPGLSSIIHYSQDNSDNGRKGHIPGTLICTTNLLPINLLLFSYILLSEFYSTLRRIF